ncbi:Fis family transcriptional regulator [Bacillus sp. FJAT-22090]|uniref:sigma-54 interaction domain-containing protein n=1 Tax=Bacillus sp. FJAT-22090 TaxID=1581038 RepID=UPI0006AE8042|nr:sigma 54-interacting transcriptional regulator [Bacillus sp. FJAT-22090]ALC86087.1 Fis family transcriptional regulator [Bacillus sp. FJAT-22090]
MTSNYKLVQSIINLFGDLLQIEIAFFTPKGEILSATDEYRKQKGKQVHLPFFQKFYSESFQYVQKPGKMNMCIGCRFQNNCPSKVEILMNLVKDDRHFGYLTFVSFTDEGEKNLFSEQKKYQYWLARLGEIIIDVQNNLGFYISLETNTGIEIDTKYVLGDSPHLQFVKSKLNNIANSSSSIVITGETGTGKSLLAKYIHSNSISHKGKFVEINCASIPENLFESELFGYEEGAFTGAKRKGKPGYFEIADKGTLFLDEITELPLHLQAKLLTVLQDGFVYRVGSIEPKKVNVRIVAATNRPLEEMVKIGEFRADLYYRLNVIPIALPPLRHRKDELEHLIFTLLEKIQQKTGKFINDFSEEFFEELKSYNWPGNIRELENVLEYSMVMENSLKLTKASLPNHIIRKKNMQIPNVLKDMELELISQKIAEYGNDTAGKERVAEELGISKRTLYRKLKKVVIENEI